METDELLKAAEQAKSSIDRQIELFISKVRSAVNDPENCLTMSQLEKEWRELSLNTHKTYSDMVGLALTSLDTKELNKLKKALSSRKASG